MSKELFRALCAKEDSIPVFSRDWWLDAACGDDWETLVKEKNGRVQAAMTLFVPCRHIVTMPHYTQNMGIWFAPEAPDTKYASLLEHRQAACHCFIEQLKRYKSFHQTFSYEFTDWLPFYWEGYAQTTRYTYLLHQIKDIESIRSEMSQQIRRNIRTAEEQSLTVRQDVPTDDFLKMQALTFERQNRRNTQSATVLRRLIYAAKERGQGAIFGGYDTAGRLHAAAFIVWQKSSAYFIAGGGDPALRASGANSLVMWEAIKHVAQYTDTFDFEGSMIQGVERFFREFGAVQTPYFLITRGRLNPIERLRIKMKYI